MAGSRDGGEDLPGWESLRPALAEPSGQEDCGGTSDGSRGCFEATRGSGSLRVRSSGPAEPCGAQEAAAPGAGGAGAELRVAQRS